MNQQLARVRVLSHPSCIALQVIMSVIGPPDSPRPEYAVSLKYSCTTSHVPDNINSVALLLFSGKTEIIRSFFCSHVIINGFLLGRESNPLDLGYYYQ